MTSLQAKAVILFLAANPRATTPLQLGEEVRTIDERLQAAAYRDQFELEQHWAVRPTDLSGLLLRHRPPIVHFSGHGTQSGQILLESEGGQADAVPVDALRGLFAEFKGTVQLVVLNACWSQSQAEALIQSVDCVVGMSRAIGDVDARRFAGGFYRALAFGEDVQTAFNLGCNEIDLAKLPGGDTPHLLTRPGVAAETLIFARPPSTPAATPLPPTRNWTGPVLIGTLLAVMSLLFGAIALLPESTRAGFLQNIGLIPIPTVAPTATPSPIPTVEPLPAGFNVVVAGFGYAELAGEAVVANIAGDNVSDIIFSQIKEVTGIDYLLGWRDGRVGRLLADTAEGRKALAEQLASALNADVVIYGVVTAKGLNQLIAPEFHLSAAFASVEPDLEGSDSGRLGGPIEVLRDSDDALGAAGTVLGNRLQAVRGFLRGLSLYLNGDHRAAQTAFESALSADPSLEPLYINAGNAALRAGDFEGAYRIYTEAIRRRANYARALAGRASAIFALARNQQRSTPATFDPTAILPNDFTCLRLEAPLPNSVQLKLVLALRCLDSAAASPDSVAVNDIDVKVTFERAQIYLFQTQNGYGDRWAEGQDATEAVIRAYAESTPARQARIRQRTAIAYGFLAEIVIATAPRSPENIRVALEHYRQSLALFEADANTAYNAPFMARLKTEISRWEAWLQSALAASPAPAGTDAAEDDVR